MHRAAAVLLAILAAAPVQAAVEACLTTIGGADIPLSYDTSDKALRDNRSMRERLFGGYGHVTCPGYVTLRAMTPDLTDDQRQPFCLVWDEKADTYTGFQVGKRDAWSECSAPSGLFCRGVNASAQTAGAVAGAIGRAATGAPLTGGANATLDTASGALIATGAGSSILTMLGTAASSAVAALSAPAVAAGAAITVVAVGGAVYVCGE